jgi:hypothetical protein
MNRQKSVIALALLSTVAMPSAEGGIRIKIKIKKPRITIAPIKVTLPKCAEDICKVLEKAKDDVAAEAHRTVKNTGEAIEAAGKFVERSVQGSVQSVENAAERVREGKLIDAAWHLAIDPIKNTENNALLAVQESTILNTLAQLSASTMGGGPIGGAAYASWLAYRQTGNLELAMRVGLITGAAAYTMAEVGTIQSQGLDVAMAKKAVLSATIAGAAVAASGGDEAAIREALLRAGTMVVVQSLYQHVARHSLDPASSRGEGYCVLTPVGAPCSPETSDLYLKDSDGNIVYETRMINGVERQVPIVRDITVLDPSRPHVGNMAAVDQTAWNFEQSRFMQAISRIPGMNTMSVFHDQWSLNFQMDPLTNMTSIVPAVYLTYLGTDAAILDLIREVSVDGKRN